MEALKTRVFPPVVIQPTKEEAKAKRKAKKEKLFQEKRKRQIAKCKPAAQRGALSERMRGRAAVVDASSRLLLSL